jgi:hypothetical protein
MMVTIRVHLGGHPFDAIPGALVEIPQTRPHTWRFGIRAVADRAGEFAHVGADAAGEQALPLVGIPKAADQQHNLLVFRIEVGFYVFFDFFHFRRFCRRDIGGSGRFFGGRAGIGGQGDRCAGGRDHDRHRYAISGDVLRFLCSLRFKRQAVGHGCRHRATGRDQQRRDDEQNQ